MTRTITIDPITRLEGHGKISIFLDADGNVEQAVLQVPELRGFEAFCVGRPAEEMPQITSRICGVCPTTHHMAATKALDALFAVEPPLAAKLVRELVNTAFMLEDHALHFYILAGPDFVVGPDAPAAQRNILGMVGILGKEVVGRVVAMRRRLRDVITYCGGKVIHPVLGLPGGVSKPLPEAKRAELRQLGEDALAFALFTLKTFEELVLGRPDYVDLIKSEAYYHETHYMGLVDEQDQVNFYDGKVRVVDPQGRQVTKFAAADYAQHIAEHVEPWTYVKFPYLRKPGWRGFVDGAESGIYRVAPLGRLNASSGMATPRAQAEYERFYDTFGAQVVHHTLATHWARIIEMIYAAERIAELAAHPELTADDVRNMNLQTPREGVGVVEAPRGTLIHHYQSDARGVLTACNLIVATVANSAAISMSIERAARGLIRGGKVDDGLLNRVEMAFRAYDPCLSCATHALGQTPLLVRVFDAERRCVATVGQGG
jgi:F420-non-reducing hydrogenase large subunit